MIEFGEKIRKARETKGLTQQSLADLIFVTRQTISRYENGERYPDILTLKKLASVLEVSVDELLDDNEAIKIVERNPIIEKPVLNNIIIFCYSIIIFVFGLLTLSELSNIRDITKELSTVLKNNEYYMWIMLFVDITIFISFLYGIVILIQGKMNAKKSGIIISCFLLTRVIMPICQILFLHTKLFVIFITIPYGLGLISTYFYFIKNNSKIIYPFMIILSSLFGIGTQIYVEYSLLMYADHLYSSLNSWSSFTLIMIYISFIFQTISLNKKRILANSLIK